MYKLKIKMRLIYVTVWDVFNAWCLTCYSVSYTKLYFNLLYCWLL